MCQNVVILFRRVLGVSEEWLFHLTLLRHQNIKTSLCELSKKYWVLQSLLFFRPVRDKLKVTVSLDHPVFGLNKTWTLLYPDPSVFPGLTKLISESLPFVNLLFSARLPACISWWKVFRKWFFLNLIFLESLFIIRHISCKWNQANPKKITLRKSLKKIR